MQALLAIRDKVKANGLLVGTVTELSPYPRLAVGLQLKLLGSDQRPVALGVDQVWDSTDRNVQKRIRAYYRKELRSGSRRQPLSQELVTVSPLEFRQIRGLRGGADPRQQEEIAPAGRFCVKKPAPSAGISFLRQKA